MAHPLHPDLNDILSHFPLRGRLLNVYPYGSGHINDTYRSCFQQDGRVVHYIHQWINHHVFKEPEKVMENIERVTALARRQIAQEGGDPSRETLTLLPTLDGKPFYRAPDGEPWRTYTFIEGARSYDVAEAPRQLYHAAKAFGRFQKMLCDLPAPRLHETIPDFHHTSKRFERFISILEEDPRNRAIQVKGEIEFILDRVADTSVVINLLESGEIPERVTHNDTKLNNVLIDDVTGEGLCVIDLDTVMPGSALYDFGDMVRAGACTAAEDEPVLKKVNLDLRLFENLACGYLEAIRGFLTPAEIDRLPFSGKLITLEQAIRFLGDYLQGDVYYKIHRPGQNLDRARTQIKLVDDIEKNIDKMDAIVEKYR